MVSADGLVFESVVFGTGLGTSVVVVVVAVGAASDTVFSSIVALVLVCDVEDDASVLVVVSVLILVELFGAVVTAVGEVEAPTTLPSLSCTNFNRVCKAVATCALSLPRHSALKVDSCLVTA